MDFIGPAWNVCVYLEGGWMAQTRSLDIDRALAVARDYATREAFEDAELTNTEG